MDESHEEDLIRRDPNDLDIDNTDLLEEKVFFSEIHPDEFKSSAQKLSFRDVLPQIIISCIAHCLVIQAGINMAYTTVLEDGLKENFSLTLGERSWIASLVTLSLPIGALIVGPLMDLLGRKKMCILACVPDIASWILCICTDSIDLIYWARCITGFSGGLSTVVLIYISEITHPQIRPMLLCFNSVFVSLGILITYCLGAWITWDQIAIVFLTMKCCIMFMIFFIPESPYWIMCFKNNSLDERTKQAEKVLRRLNKSEQGFEEEFARIKQISELYCENNESFNTKIVHFFKMLKEPVVYKPTILLFVIFLTQQLSGTYVIIFYALDIFENIGKTFGKGLDKYGAMVLLGVIRFYMSLITALSSKKCGRRMLCICSGLGMTFSMFFSAMYIYLTSAVDENGKTKEVMAEQQWLLLVIVLFYVCSSSFGFVVIPWTLIGELYPIAVKGVMGGVMVSVAYFMMFGMIKSYPYMREGMGTMGVFLLFSGTSLIGTAFIYVFLPETLGKSFSEIENYFIGNKNSNNRVSRDER